MTSRLLQSCSLLCLLAALPAVAMADDALSPRAEVSVKGGSKRSILTTEFWAPLAQQSGKILYGDLRLMGDNDDNREGNLGFGYRQISKMTNSVLGGHIWIDRRRTDNNNTFHQITIGAESLGNVIDLRANGYIALNGSKTAITPNLGSTTPYLAGNGVYIDTNGRITETAQHGADAEIGYRLRVLQNYADAIRIFGGGYDFFGNGTDNLIGYRVRTEAQINSAISVGARFQHDNQRGDQGFLEATLRFPFSAKKLYQQKGLYGRLDESPQRDVDIVTSHKAASGLMQPLLNASGSQQRILYVDNSQSNGNGTKEHPFNNLASAQAALQANDILYIAAGNGTTSGMDQGITISQNNVSIVGSGSDLAVDGFTFISAGAAPMITNSTSRPDEYTRTDNLSSNAVRISSSGNITVTGLNISNTQGYGIYIDTQANSLFDTVTITNNMLRNNSRSDVFGAGIYISMASTAKINTLNIGNNDVSGTNGNSPRNIQIAGPGTIHTVNVTNNTVNSGGYDIILQSSGVWDTLNVTGNTVSQGNGIFVNVGGSVGSRIGTTTITNNRASFAGTGIQVAPTSFGVMENVVIANNIIDNNTLGLRIAPASGGSIGNLSIANNEINTNPNNCCNLGFGILFSPTGIGTSINTTSIANNNIIGNGADGVSITTDNYATMNKLTMDSNNILNNVGYGINIYTQHSSVINDIQLKNMSILNNGNTGASVRADTASTIGNVTIDNVNASNAVTNSGIYVASIATGTTIGTVTISSSIANNNLTNAGIAISGLTGGKMGSVTLQNNTTNNNKGANGRGVFVTMNSASTIDSFVMSGNTASNNTQQGLYLGMSNANTAISALTLTNNIMNNNGQQGMQIANNAGLISTLSLSGNTTNDNAQQGTYVQILGAGKLTTANIVNNNANNNTGANGRGIMVESNGAAGTTIGLATLTGNTTNGNAQQGIYIFGNSAAGLSVSMVHNTSTNNAVNGLYVNKATTGTFVVDAGGGALGSTGQNRIWNNTGTEVRVDGGYALNAQTDYWGGGDLVVGEKTLNGGSTVTTTGFLTSDPGP